MRRTLGWILVLVLVLVGRAAGQGLVVMTRAEAVAAALARNPQLAIARADTLQAMGELLTARGLPNPTLSASYSKSVPRYHVTAELPLDLLGLRNTRIRAAEAARLAAQYRFAYARAAASLDADTTYTRALAAAARMELSARNAVAADSVRRIAIARRDAGDASELDVQLAIVSAGQAENAAAADSLLLATTLLDLQSLIGIAGQEVTVRLADSLTPPGALPETTRGTTLPIAGAIAALQSATLAAAVQHRSVWLLPGLMFGFEAGDPTGAEPGILPTFGITVPLPFINRNRGPIAEAEAARQRAQSELDFARIDGENRIAAARRAGASASARIGRDQLLVASANRVAAMSLAAYREGAAPLATVLEAQRSAREILGQYVDDVAAAAIAASLLRVLTLTPSSVTTP
jgi:cobalt-zinc-cadmium efflux system outer membrane protein